MKTNKAFKRWLKTTQAKQLFSLCRWLHIYISTALFSLLVFFCFTGITLNHPNWGKSNNEQVLELRLPDALALLTQREAEEMPIKKIQSFVESQTGLSNPKSIDYLPDAGEFTLDYPLPAGYAFVTVILEEQLVEVAYKKGSFIGLLNDLHKGRHSGKSWLWLIDISAGFMLLFSITGLVILLQNAKHRRLASWLVIMGTFTPVFLYFIAVPRITI